MRSVDGSDLTWWERKIFGRYYGRAPTAIRGPFATWRTGSRRDVRSLRWSSGALRSCSGAGLAASPTAARVPWGCHLQSQHVLCAARRARGRSIRLQKMQRRCMHTLPTRGHAKHFARLLASPTRDAKMTSLFVFVN
jgi:hypothetical protein